MKLFRVTGASGEIVFQERVPDATPTLYMQWRKPLYTSIIRLEVIEVASEKSEASEAEK